MHNRLHTAQSQRNVLEHQTCTGTLVKVAAEAARRAPRGPAIDSPNNTVQQNLGHVLSLGF